MKNSEKIISLLSKKEGKNLAKGSVIPINYPSIEIPIILTMTIWGIFLNTINKKTENARAWCDFINTHCMTVSPVHGSDVNN